VRDVILAAPPSAIAELAQEIARTQSGLRVKFSPRAQFDERWKDLSLCLQLDGYTLDEYDTNQFIPIEPALEGAVAVEDDLSRELKRSGLSRHSEVIKILDGSASLFKQGKFFNGCLNNARVALETLAATIAEARRAHHPGDYDPQKWGEVISYLRKSSFLTLKQEDGLTGLYSFLSPGSHVPVGFTEQEFARLGRSVAVSLCYFLVRRFNASRT
jgi:hypothetical protein